MSKIVARCKFCEELYLTERPLFRCERDLGACPSCTAKAIRNMKIDPDSEKYAAPETNRG